MTVVDNSKTVFTSVVDSATGKMSKQRYPAGRPAAAHAQDAVSRDIFGISLCEFAVGALCSTGGGAGCYGACVALALTTGPGGLACATVCSLIAFLGCAGATAAICG